MWNFGFLILSFNLKLFPHTTGSKKYTVSETTPIVKNMNQNMALFK